MTAPQTLQDLSEHIGIPTDKPKTQADTRLDINADDQFGRGWMFSVEKETMDPVGEFNRIAWPFASDPLKTPTKYVVMLVGRHGQKDLGRVEIDFPQWIKDVRQGLNNWNEAVMGIGQEKFGGSMTVEALFKDPRVLSWAGPRPSPSIKALQAAAAGDRELLGLVELTDQGRALINELPPVDLDQYHPVDAQAASMAPEEIELPQGVPAQPETTITVSPPNTLSDDPAEWTYKQFMSNTLKNGGTMADAALGWNTHKANLNAE